MPNLHGNTKDITGQRFGRWTVLNFVDATKGHARWFCECDCGTRSNVYATLLRSGKSQSCGCSRLEIAKEIIGKRFGRLIVVGIAGKRRGYRWLCQCDCGGQTISERWHLENGSIQRCWDCRNVTHGATGTREYRCWTAMHQRCSNPNNPAFKYYGARGIKVCERWNKFENFLADMGLCPDGYSIERINNDGDYEPGNCKWIPMEEQAKNTRKQAHSFQDKF